MDFIAAGEETASDLGQPPSLASSEGFPVQCTVREVDFLFAPVFGCENYKGSWQPCVFEFLIESVLEDMYFFNFDKPEFSVR